MLRRKAYQQLVDWKNNKHDNHKLEFLIEKNGEVVPIEVKAGNTHSTSLNNFIKDYSPSIAYKLVSVMSE